MSTRSRLGLQARLTLIKRLAMNRADDVSLALLDRVTEGGARLQQKYYEIARSRVALAGVTGKLSHARPMASLKNRIWLPTVIEIQDLIEEVGNVKRMLQVFVDRYRTRAATTMSPAAADKHVHNSMSSPSAS